MNRVEVAKLLAIIAGAHPNFEAEEAKVTIWHELLGDLDYEAAQRAVHQHITTSKWIPTIAEIREQATRSSRPEHMTPGEAWHAVHGAVQRYGYYEPRKGLESLPSLVAYAAQQIGWTEICMETQVGMLRSQYMRIYEQLVERAKREELVPPQLQLEKPGWTMEQIEPTK